VSELTVVEQRGEALRGCVPWILDQDGNMTAGFDDERRMGEVQEGLMRHDGVRSERSDAGAAEVDETLAALHEPRYLRALRRAPDGEAVLVEGLAEPGLQPDTPVCAAAVRAAREGVATSISAANRILAGRRFSYALCRPPGHHAGPAWLGGYCYLNNAAAAAHTLATADTPLAPHTPTAAHTFANGDTGDGREIAILDVDLHYPNGTAALVARMSSASLHSLDGATGANMPWERVRPRSEREHLVTFRNAPSADQYLQALADVVERISASAAAIVLSLGYDTIAQDPHGAWSFQPSIFARIGALLAGCGLPVCVVQEGGYALGALADCSHAFVTGLLNGSSA
jgi:acetoin utilization deacetylase AcuC-like enzyme